MNELSTQEHKPLGYLEVEDGDKVVRIPYYHDPKMNCGCMTCKLANGEVSVDFYKGYMIGHYVAEISAEEAEKKDLSDECITPFFDDLEIASFIMNG